MTNEQSATLLRLNKQAQVAALNAVGFSDVTENSRASEFGQRIKWAAGLLDLHLACNRISDNSKAYFTAAEWNSLTLANKQLYIKRGLRIRAHGHSFVIAAQECYNADMTTTFYWGGQGKAIDGLNQKGLGAMYGCFTGEEDTDLIIATLKDQNNSGVIGAPAAEAARAYGRLNAWLYPSLGVIDRFVYLDFDELRILPDFGSAEPTVADRVSFRLSARLLFIAAAALRVLYEFWREKVLDVFL